MGRHSLKKLIKRILAAVIEYKMMRDNSGTSELLDTASIHHSLANKPDKDRPHSSSDPLPRLSMDCGRCSFDKDTPFIVEPSVEAAIQRLRQSSTALQDQSMREEGQKASFPPSGSVSCLSNIPLPNPPFDVILVAWGPDSLELMQKMRELDNSCWAPVIIYAEEATEPERDKERQATQRRQVVLRAGAFAYASTFRNLIRSLQVLFS